MRDIIIRMKEEKNSKFSKKKIREADNINIYNLHAYNPPHGLTSYHHDQYSLWNFIHSSAREKFNLSPNLNIEYTFSPNLLINKISDINFEMKRQSAFVCNNFEQIFENKKTKEDDCSLPNRMKGFLNEYCLEKTKPKKKLLSFSFQNNLGIKTSLNKKRVPVIQSPKTKNQIFKVEKNYVKFFLNKKRRREIESLVKDKETPIIIEDKNSKNQENPNLKKDLTSIFIENIFELKNIKNVKNVKNESDNIKLESNNIKLESNDFNCFKIESPIVLKYDFFNENKILNNSKCRSRASVRQGMKYKMFPLDVKLMCLEMVKKIGDLRQISEIFQVPMKSLKRWLAVGPARKKGCGRKVRDPVLEKKLLAWYNRRAQVNDFPTPNEVTRKALELSDDPKFMASKGWLEKFKNKFNITLKTRISRSNTCLSK
jgi:hypothetical protein